MQSSGIALHRGTAQCLFLEVHVNNNEITNTIGVDLEEMPLLSMSVLGEPLCVCACKNGMIKN